VNTTFTQRSNEVIQDLALIKAQEEELLDIVEHVEKDKKALEKEETSLYATLETLEGRQEDVVGKEKALEESEKEFSHKEKEIAIKEKHIAKAKEINQDINELKNVYDNWVALIKKQKESYGKKQQDIVGKREYLKDFEAKLSKKLGTLDEKQAIIREEERHLVEGEANPLARQYFMDDLGGNEDEGFIESRMHEKRLQEIHGILQGVRNLIQQGNMDQAKVAIAKAESMALPAPEKRKLTYGLKELKTEIELAQL
jgi:DNA repair exonuclease SbcCD ATPase subunit